MRKSWRVPERVSSTHSDLRDVDLAALSTFTTDEEIQSAANQAYGEAHSIFAYLGVTASQIYGVVGTRLPAISSWFSPEEGQDSDYESDTESVALASESGTDGDYQAVLDTLEGLEHQTEREEKRAMDHCYATIALSISDHISMYVHFSYLVSTADDVLTDFSASLPELNEEAMEEAYSEDASRIAMALSSIGSETANSLRPVYVDEEVNPFNADDPSTVDLNELVRLRFKNQTKQARTGVRTSTRSPLDEHQNEQKPLSDRQAILRKFNEIIKSQGDRGIGTGLERNARWRNPAPGGRSGIIDGEAAPSAAAGNSANAAGAAKAAATKVRSELFRILYAFR